jgi:hypothetical protein
MRSTYPVREKSVCSMVATSNCSNVPATPETIKPKKSKITLRAISHEGSLQATLFFRQAPMSLVRPCQERGKLEEGREGGGKSRGHEAGDDTSRRSGRVRALGYTGSLRHHSDWELGD